MTLRGEDISAGHFPPSLKCPAVSSSAQRISTGRATITAQPKVIRVGGEVLHKRTSGRNAASLPPIFWGYRYAAVLEDGSAVTIRSNEGRQYAWAYQWAHRVATAKSGLASHFTFSTGRDQRSAALAVFRIEWL